MHITKTNQQNQPPRTVLRKTLGKTLANRGQCERLSWRLRLCKFQFFCSGYQIMSKYGDKIVQPQRVNAP